MIDFLRRVYTGVLLLIQRSACSHESVLTFRFSKNHYFIYLTWLKFSDAFDKSLLQNSRLQFLFIYSFVPFVPVFSFFFFLLFGGNFLLDFDGFHYGRQNFFSVEHVKFNWFYIYVVTSLSVPQITLYFLKFLVLKNDSFRAYQGYNPTLNKGCLMQVSRSGSVKVEKLMNIERYSHVMHISSTVSYIF